MKFDNPKNLWADASGSALQRPDGTNRVFLNEPSGVNSLGFPLWDFSTLTGYSLSAGSMSLVDSVAVSATLRKTTSKSIQFTVVAGAGNAELSLPTLAAAARIPNKSIALVIEMTAGTTGSSAALVQYLNTGTYSHFYNYSIQLNRYGVQVIHATEGTNIHDWSVGAGSPTFDTLTSGKLRFTATGTDLTVTVHAIMANASTIPTVSIIHDDGDYTGFTKLLPLLNRYGFKAGFSIISDLITNTGSIYMYEKHLAQLYAEGHDLMPHGQYNLNTYGSAALALADIDKNADWLLARGYLRGSRGYIYPNGNYIYSTSDRTSILNHLADRGFTDAWSASGYVNPWLGGYERMFRTRYGITATTNLTTLSNWFSVLPECGKDMTLMIHEIVNSGASGAQSNVADLATILADLRTRQNAGTLRVVTPSQQGGLWDA